jgi:hypothetical protein
MADRLRLLLVGTVAWLGLAAMSLWFLGVWPRTAVGWLLVLALGPFVAFFLQVAGEMIGNAFSSLPGIQHADCVVERRTASQKFSGLRIAYRLVRMLLFLVPIVLVLIWLKGRDWPTVPTAIAQWWGRHFN